MIPPETWIPQIVRYAAFAADESRLHRAWIEHDYSETSVTDYSEFYVQLFDDQDADNLETQMVALLDGRRGGAISRFLSAIRIADQEFESDERYTDMRTLLASSAWGGIQRAAREVVNAFADNPWKASGAN
jgi:hypothetical protein